MIRHRILLIMMITINDHHSANHECDHTDDHKGENHHDDNHQVDDAMITKMMMMMMMMITCLLPCNFSTLTRTDLRWRPLFSRFTWSRSSDVMIVSGNHMMILMILTPLKMMMMPHRFDALLPPAGTLLQGSLSLLLLLRSKVVLVGHLPRFKIKKTF